MIDRQGMTERDQFTGAFGAHDAGQLGNAENIPFFDISLYNQLQCFWAHGHRAPRNGQPHAVCFRADIYHTCLAAVVKMGKLL